MDTCDQLYSVFIKDSALYSMDDYYSSDTIMKFLDT